METAENRMGCPLCSELMDKPTLASLAYFFYYKATFDYGGDLSKMLEEEVFKHLNEAEKEEGRGRFEALQKQVNEAKDTFRKYPGYMESTEVGEVVDCPFCRRLADKETIRIKLRELKAVNEELYLLLVNVLHIPIEA